MNPLSDLILNENAGAHIATLSGITSGATNENQTLTLSATSSNPSLVPTPTVSYTSPNTTGSLSFKPLTNAFGSALVTVTVNDGQAGNNLINRSFTVTVNPVNQRPTLNPLSNLTLSAGAGWQTVNLSGITAGPPNEIQTLSLIATSSIPSLIPDPIVSYIYPSTTGSITFKPFPKAVGSVMLRVTVFDGQATNKTFHRSFTVTIDPISGTKTVLAAFASAGPQLLSTPSLQSDGSMLVSAKPRDGGPVLETDLAVLQAWGSTNLTHWDPLPVPLVVSNNAVWLRDYSATNCARRYYRLGNP